MAEGSKWTPGKIFLLIAGILGGLGLICCGGIYFLAGDKIMGMVSLGTNSVECSKRLTAEFGAGTTFELIPDGREFIPAVGVPGELTPERVTKVQDGAWKIVAEVFAKDGFVPASQFAVGNSGSPGKAGTGRVSNWTKNMVPIDELVARTGVPRPPLANFLPEELSGGKVEVKVTTTPDAEDEGDKEDGGGEGK
jgi:hypothetical protein